MEQEGIPANPAQSGCLRDKSELQPTLSGIVNDLALKSVPIELFSKISAYLKHVIICITTLRSTSRLTPNPLFRCDHVMANSDCSGSLWHKGRKKLPLPFSETLNRNSAKVTTRPRRSGLVKNIIKVNLFHIDCYLLLRQTSRLLPSLRASPG
jgi:hypothetical protein